MERRRSVVAHDHRALHNSLQVYVVRLPRAACLAVEAAKQVLNEAFARAVLDERCNELIEQVNDCSSFSCAPDVVVVAERIEGHRWHVPLLPAGNEEVQLRLQHLPSRMPK